MYQEDYCPVKEIESILVAVDRSVYSEGAITEAISYSRQCSSRLYVLTILQDKPVREFLQEGLRQQEEQEARVYLETVKTRAEAAMVGCETILRHGGNPADLILEEAVERNVAMIVVGRHGRTGLEKAILGSVSTEVIGRAACKVLVASIGTEIECKKILLATDGSPNAETAVLEAIYMAKHCGSSLLVVSVVPAKNELPKAIGIVEQVSVLAKNVGISTEAMTPVGSPHDVITEIAHNQGVDLIVMGTHGKSGIKKHFMGSTTSKVIGWAHCAVLVVNNPQ